jgi:hypothetical protein
MATFLLSSSLSQQSSEKPPRWNQRQAIGRNHIIASGAVADLALEKKADFERPVHARAKATSVKMVVYAGFTVRTRYVRVGAGKERV